MTAALVGAPVPVVVIGDLGNAPLDTVRTDSRVGVRLAYEHLLDRSPGWRSSTGRPTPPPAGP